MSEIRAVMWGCGDDCECREPQIVKVTPSPRNPGWVECEVLERGVFISDPEPSEAAEQWAWLVERARARQVSNLAEIEAEWGAAKP